MLDAALTRSPDWWAQWVFRAWPTEWPRETARGRKQTWRREWPALNLSIPTGEWEGDLSASCLTGPEVAASLSAGRTRRARYARDHDVLAVMAATTLKDVDVALAPYRGPDIGMPDDVEDDHVVDEYQRKGAKYPTKLTANDVRRAWPRFVLAWQALDSLAEAFVWRGEYADDGRPLTALSRHQIMPWCALSERKARMFGALLERRGIVVRVPAPATERGNDGNLYALNRPGQ